MRLGNLKSVKEWLPNHVTASDRLWLRESDAVTESEIHLFYARWSARGHKREAVEAIDALQAAVIVSAFKGELQKPPVAIVMHELRPDPFMVDELVDGLTKLRPARRQACLYALEMDITPEAAAGLFWSDAVKLQNVPTICREILEAASKTRHIMLPYVFWEIATVRIATPLIELEWSITQAFGCTWPELVSQYRNIVLLDRHAESASFLELCQSV